MSLQIVNSFFSLPSGAIFTGIMLTRRFLSSSQQPSSLVRTLSTSSAAYARKPSLADITPDAAPTFDAHQKRFRDSVKEAQKVKKEQDSQSVTASKSSSDSAPGGAPTAHETSNASATEASGSIALGLLSTHDAGAARDSAYKQESTKRKGALSSLIYGTHEGQQMDKDIEKSFSQVLARGKYVHSIVFHSVKPDKVDEYVELVGGWYPRMAKLEENHVNLVGSWRTEVGDCDTFGKQ